MAGEAEAGTGPVLARDDAVWRGDFAGLGAVSVQPDGVLTIDVDDRDDPDDEERRQRHDALRWGWAEPLGWVRRGYELVVGTALVAPDGGAALVLRGHVHDVPIVVCGLAQRGWAVLADRFVPLRWSAAGAEAQPTEAPVLLARRRAEAMGFEGVAVREDSDARIVPVPTAGHPALVGGVVDVVGRRVGSPTFERLVGHERFELASRLVAGGVLVPDGDPLPPSERMARDLQIAALPLARAHLEADAPAGVVEAIEAWWRTT